MEIYSKVCPMVQWVVGMFDRLNKRCLEEDISHVLPIVLETLYSH